jgi:hypothetical protein
MASALVWSTESVLLGLWALVFSTYSTPLHVFVARSHVLISSFTLLLHLYVKSRGLVIGPAISQVFVCAVSALFLVYISMLCEENSAARFFKMPSVGWLTLDACIGLAWFVVALISSVGMALSFVKKDSPEKHTLSLMFHSYGVHLVIVLPCLSVILGVGGWYGEIVFLGCVCVWVAHIVLMGMQIFMWSVPLYDRDSHFSGLVVLSKITYVAIELCTRFFLIAISCVAMLSPGISFQQRMFVLGLLVVSVVMALDIFYVVYYTLGMVIKLPALPTLDDFFGGEWEKNRMDTSAHSNNQPSVPPLQTVDVPSAPTLEMLQTKSRFSQQPSPLRYNLTAQLPDPAAVSISRRYLVDFMSKNV